MACTCARACTCAAGLGVAFVLGPPTSLSSGHHSLWGLQGRLLVVDPKVRKAGPGESRCGRLPSCWAGGGRASVWLQGRQQRARSAPAAVGWLPSRRTPGISRVARLAGSCSRLGLCTRSTCRTRAVARHAGAWHALHCTAQPACLPAVQLHRTGGFLQLSAGASRRVAAACA